MALTASAKKRVRRNNRARVRNKSRLSNTRGEIRKVEEALAAGNAAAAAAALKAAQPKIHRTADKGLIHKKTAARKLSRLSARIKALAGKKK